MSDTNPVPTISDLQTEAIMLSGLLEGLDVVLDSTCLDYNSENITERRAANAMRPLVEAAIRSANELADLLETMEVAERRAGLNTADAAT